MPRGIEVARAGGEQHRRVSTLDDVEHAGRVESCGSRVDTPRSRGRAGVHVGSELDQCLHDVRVTLRHRPHQRRLSPGPFRGIHIRAMLNQLAHGVGRSGARRRHQHRLARGQRGVRACSGRQQGPDHRGAAIDAGQPEGRDAKVVRRVDGCARLKERVRHRRVVPMRGPVEGGCAVGLWGGGVHTLAQERAHARRICGLGRVNQARVCVPVLGAGGKAGDGQQRRHAPTESAHVRALRG